MRGMCKMRAEENLDHNSPFLNLLASYLSPRTRQTNRGLGKKASHIGQEFVGGGFTPGSHGIDALVVGFYNGEALIYAARVRAGLVPATRRELYARVKPLAGGGGDCGCAYFAHRILPAPPQLREDALSRPGV